MLGLVTIGQSPRPDLVEAFGRHAQGVEIRVAGALDDLTRGEIDHLAARPTTYPLLTRLADGSTVTIGREILADRVEAKALELASSGASLVVIACAGAFPEVRSPVPVLLPGKLLPAIVGTICQTRRIGVVTPTAGQVDAARRKWQEDGFDAEVTWAAPYDHANLPAACRAMSGRDLELVVLDCMGHGSGYRREFERRCGRPVLLAQSVVARVAAELVGA